MKHCLQQETILRTSNQMTTSKWADSTKNRAKPLSPFLLFSFLFSRHQSQLSWLPYNLLYPSLYFSLFHNPAICILHSDFCLLAFEFSPSTAGQHPSILLFLLLSITIYCHLFTRLAPQVCFPFSLYHQKYVAKSIESYAPSSRLYLNFLFVTIPPMPSATVALAFIPESLKPIARYLMRQRRSFTAKTTGPFSHPSITTSAPFFSRPILWC